MTTTGVGEALTLLERELVRGLRVAVVGELGEDAFAGGSISPLLVLATAVLPPVLDADATLADLECRLRGAMAMSWECDAIGGGDLARAGEWCSSWWTRLPVSSSRSSSIKRGDIGVPLSI